MASLSSRALGVALRFLVKRKLRNGLSVAAIRDGAATLERWLGGGAAANPGRAVRIGEFHGEWFDPATADEKRVVLYLHGGGFISNLPSAYRAFARRLANALGALVLLPDYRLAPEHPFPAGPDDCLAAYRWLLEQGVASTRIVIAGDSAGGNLALVTAIRIRDAALPAPGCVVMLSPVTDFTGASESIRSNRDLDPLLVPELQPFLLMVYAPNQPATHRWISPLEDGLECLPPLLFHVGSTELIRDDSIRAADKARATGVTVELEVWPDMPHVFQLTNLLPEAKAAVTKIAGFVRQQVPTAP